MNAGIVELIGFGSMFVSALLLMRLVAQLTERVESLKLLAQASQFD